ncbi:MAG: virulence RhuM family protein [Methanothrix sp.]|nr:virulence RhuM family protein [Methanothrix sp.]
MLERILDIRASEKRFYQKIRDIYTLSIGCYPQLESTQEFIKMVQNKLHWAITGHTAAEIITERTDATRPNMGLTSWKGARGPAAGHHCCQEPPPCRGNRRAQPAGHS